MTVSRVREQRRKVFGSVFQTDVSQPTPILSATEVGEPFGGPLASFAVPTHLSALGGTSKSSKPRAGSTQAHSHDQEQHHPQHRHHLRNRRSQSHQTAEQATSASEQQVSWDRAWHIVTSRIQLPSSVAVEDSFGTLAPESQDLDVDAQFYDSLSIVLHPRSAVPRAAHTEDALLWHTQQVRQHFVHHVLPLLAACAGQGERNQVLLSSIQTLEAAHRQYLFGLSLLLRGFGPNESSAAEAAVARFRRDLHAIIGNSWARGLLEALRNALRWQLGTVLGSRLPHSGLGSHEEDAAAARTELHGLVESLHNVGLAGDRFQVVLAETMDFCMQDFIQQTYSGIWTSPDPQGPNNPSQSDLSLGCMNHLCDWVENQYGRLAVEIFSRVGGDIAWADVERWRDIAIGRLATLRMQELFDIVLHWPESRGGLDDLRSAVVTPQRRLQLTDTFSAILRRRLLHPGRATLDILQTYISMIRTFHALDHSKVLLSRVAHALQLYLCQRDDAIRIVVTGLLSNPKEVGMEEAKGKLVELAVVLNDASQQQQQRRFAEDDDLDWNDMSWVPDPVDAGVNYKRPKNEDVIGTLISALGSQDIFIKEFQLIIAERLLSNQPNFQQETKVLGLLKKRFGEHALQNCDVMIRDIQDSRRIDSVLRKTLANSAASQPVDLSYHSKILSRLFWPSLSRDSFIVPEPVAETQRRYAEGFEQLKSTRKLNWVDQLGWATVKLDLEDRSIELQCKTYEAAVIYAFQDGEGDGSEPQKRTFNGLWERLRIDEDLLDVALKFWVSKRVLRDIGDQTYIVLERLDDEGQPMETADDPSQAERPAEAGPASPRKQKMDTKERERRSIYWQFIVGMLTNSGPAMPLGQISMMMKMLIADGCPWSNEELQEFLGEKIAEDELEFSGGKYRLPKR